MKTNTLSKIHELKARERADNKIALQLSKEQWAKIGTQMGWDNADPEANGIEDVPHVDLVLGLIDKEEIIKNRPNYRFPADQEDRAFLTIEVEDLFDKDREETEMIIKSLFCTTPTRPNRNMP